MSFILYNRETMLTEFVIEQYSKAIHKEACIIPNICTEVETQVKYTAWAGGDQVLVGVKTTGS